MTEYLPQGNNNSHGDTLPPTHGSTEQSSETSLFIDPREEQTFAVIDQELHAMISVFGNNLAEVHVNSTDPAILAMQTTRMYENANRMISGAIETKILLRQKAAILAKIVTERNRETVDVSDLDVSQDERQTLILDVLLADRTKQEQASSQRELTLLNHIDYLEAKAAIRERALEDYRSDLGIQNPAALVVFDAHFGVLEVKVPVAPVRTMTQELEAIAYPEDGEVLSRIRTFPNAITAFGKKALQGVVSLFDSPRTTDGYASVSVEDNGTHTAT